MEIDKEPQKTEKDKEHNKNDNDTKNQLKQYEEEKWEKLQEENEKDKRKKKIKRIKEHRKKNKGLNNGKNKEEQFEHDIKFILNTTYKDKYEVRMIREVLEEFMGSDLEHKKRKETISQWRMALQIMAVQKGVQFTFELMMEDMRSDFLRLDGGYDVPVISKTLMKTVWDTELNFEAKQFREKMVTALVAYEETAKGTSTEIEIVTTQYENEQHGFKKKIQEALKIRTRKMKERKEKEDKEIKKKQDEENEREKRSRNIFGRRGMISSQPKPTTPQKQETTSEKEKRTKETKIRKTILDTRQLKDKIAEMLDTNIKDIMAFRYLLIDMHKNTGAGIDTIMKTNRMDITMIKLWRRALPRKIHEVGGIFRRQATFSLKIQQEIQPLWDTEPENKETIRFRKMISHFVIDKSVTQRERMITRRWDEGYKTPPELREASGPHAVLTYISESTVRRQNIGKDNRAKRERREEQWKRLLNVA